MIPDLAHFRLPAGDIQIAFSGGRSSAYMLWLILEANGRELPDRVRVTFSNTGCEMPATLDFVSEVGAWFGVRIAWLEYRAEAPFFEVVSHNSASRHGEPFAAVIGKRRFLPNQHSRFCTAELKIRTAKRFLVAQGWKGWTTAIGIRADEPHRLRDAAKKERSTPWHPLAAAGISRHDVARFWRAQPFDLLLPNIRGSTPLGNCDGCFLKSEAAIAALARDYPERAAWWEAMEARMAGRTRTARSACFSRRYSRSEVRRFVEGQGDWIFDDGLGALCQRDDGECI